MDDPPAAMMVRKLTRCALVALAAVVAACAPARATSPPPPAQPAIAVTVDDVPEHSATAPGESRLDISRRLVTALQAENVPAYGFVNGSPAEANLDDTAALDYWASAFPVGNHTWTHADLQADTEKAYEDEIAHGEPLLERLSRGRDWHWFRYPYLDEGGGDQDKKLAIRRFLASHGYRIAAVTMTFDDWKYNDANARCAAKGDQAAIAKLESDWLDAVRHSADESRTMAKALYGGDIPYVLLIHIGSFDARMLPRTLALYREMGFRFVSLEEAQSDPSYASDDDPTTPPQPSIYEMMQAKGLPMPPERVPTVDLATVCG